MLAAWMRMKFPNQFQGAVASSAPILQFKGKTNPNAYSEFASNVYKEAGGDACYDSIKYGFFDITNLKYDQNFYTTLRGKLNLCFSPGGPDDVQTVLDTLEDGLGTMAMVNYPYATNFTANIPANPVKAACDAAAAITPAES